MQEVQGAMPVIQEKPAEAPVKIRSLIGKLAAVMAQISRVKKNGVNKFQNYAYATEADLVEEVREKLGAVGIFIFTEVLEVTRTETGRKTSGGLPILLTRVKVQHTFCDSDSDETRAVCSYGEGEDTGDKGIYKATTGAVKYFLAKNFLMSTGDDPENDEEETKAAKKPRSAAQERPGFDKAITMPEHEAQQEKAARGPVAAPEGQIDHGTFTDKIKAGRLVGQSKPQDARQWKLYSIETEGHGAFATFSHTIFDQARTAVTLGVAVEIQSTPTAKGPQIEAIIIPAEALAE